MMQNYKITLRVKHPSGSITKPELMVSSDNAKKAIELAKIKWINSYIKNSGLNIEFDNLKHAQLYTKHLVIEAIKTQNI